MDLRAFIKPLGFTSFIASFKDWAFLLPFHPFHQNRVAFLPFLQSQEAFLRNQVEVQKVQFQHRVLLQD